MSRPVCSVKGCGQQATAYLRFEVPLDDGTGTTVSMPVVYCEGDRYSVDATMVTDEVWAQIEKVLPPGKRGLREDLEVSTGEILSSSVPPEINRSMARFAKAASMFDHVLQQEGTLAGVKAQAATELGHCAHATARVLRNHAGARGAGERRVAADAFDRVHDLTARVSKLLHRGDESLPAYINELRQACGTCGQLTSAALMATPGPETS